MSILQEKLPSRAISTRKRHDLTLGSDKVTVAHILTAFQPLFSMGRLTVFVLQDTPCPGGASATMTTAQISNNIRPVMAKHLSKKWEKCNNLTKFR